MQRPGAIAAYLNVFHYDIEEFIATKKINADEKSRMQTLSIGVTVPNKYIELQAKNEPMYVFAPHSVFKETGKRFCDIDFDKEYEELVSNPNIRKKKLEPRKLWDHILKTEFESGYPYIMFLSNANEKHALKNIGRIRQSNLCTEIFQLQETSVINDGDTPNEIKRDISCNLVSLNIKNIMDNNSIETSTRSAVRSVTAVSDNLFIPNASGVNKANDELHSIGVGLLNYHGYLTSVKIPYESPMSVEIAGTLAMMLNYYSISESMEIAKERNETFKDFELSDYATGEYFTKYINTDYTPKNKKVQDLFKGMHVPTQDDWKQLCEDVKTHGLYNAYRLAIAPTQSIGYIQNATASVLPVVDIVERRTYGDSTTYYPMPYLDKTNMFFYKSAYKMDMKKVTDVIAAFQEHVDQGVSYTLFVDSNTSTRQLGIQYLYAHHKGLKAIYYVRTKTISIAECESCSI